MLPAQGPSTCGHIWATESLILNPNRALKGLSSKANAPPAIPTAYGREIYDTFNTSRRRQVWSGGELGDHAHRQVQLSSPRYTVRNLAELGAKNIRLCGIKSSVLIQKLLILNKICFHFNLFYSVNLFVFRVWQKIGNVAAKLVLTGQPNVYTWLPMQQHLS